MCVCLYIHLCVCMSVNVPIHYTICIFLSTCSEPVDLHFVLHSTFILIKHRVIPMDLVLVQTPSSRIFSFLSVTWGMMADIDYESEKYRAIGEARFTVGALKRIISK